MKRIKYFLLICFVTNYVIAQSINIGTGSNLDVGLGSDVCAGEYGNVVGNLTGEGTECGKPIIITHLFEMNRPIPDKYEMGQNFPNPFNPSTKIKYSIPELSLVRMTLFNLLGEEVTTLVNEIKEAGYYEVEFNAARLPSGIYFYRIKAGQFVSIKKMVLLK